MCEVVYFIEVVLEMMIVWFLVRRFLGILESYLVVWVGEDWIIYRIFRFFFCVCWLIL